MEMIPGIANFARSFPIFSVPKIFSLGISFVELMSFFIGLDNNNK